MFAFTWEQVRNHHRRERAPHSSMSHGFPLWTTASMTLRNNTLDSGLSNLADLVRGAGSKSISRSRCSQRHLRTVIQALLGAEELKSPRRLCELGRTWRPRPTGSDSRKAELAKKLPCSAQPSPVRLQGLCLLSTGLCSS